MKETRVVGKPNLTVSMNVILATKLASHAKADKTTQSESLDTFIESYLKSAKLKPMPNGGKLQRITTDRGESRLRRYWLDPSVMEMLAEAEKIGYSRSFIVEESIKDGLDID